MLITGSRSRFKALKRRFYFEHVDGGTRLFELDLGSHARFHEILRTPANDTNHLGELIEAINRSYCPQPFEGESDSLYLWVGHRLDEQPTKSFVAGECLPSDRLSIRRPQPPAALRDAFAYVPDHLLLTVAPSRRTTSQRTSLRIDAALFRTLWAMLHGLPRHLINPDELNRLDSFMDRLRRTEPSELPEFLVHNTKHVASTRVRKSRNFDLYQRVRQL